MTVVRFLLVAAPLLLLLACNKGVRYQESTIGAPLELPPDLAGSQAESKFELPAAISGEDAAAPRDKIPVLARVDSVYLEGDGDLYWLRVEEPVENLYQLVKNFWASEGYRLIMDEPVIGMMRTEWIYHEEGAEDDATNWFEGLFTEEDFSATQDQYTVRIERDDTSKLNRIYVAHRGTEYNYVLTTDGRRDDERSDSEWTFRRPEPEKEIEMLSRLMIYLGLREEEVARQQDAVKLFKPRSVMAMDADEGSPFLIIFDPYQIAWNRVFHELERMNFTIVSSDFKSGITEEGVIYVEADTREIVEDTGLFSLQTEEQEGTIKFTLVFSEETNRSTRVILEDEKGEYETSPAGAEFIKLLHEHVK